MCPELTSRQLKKALLEILRRDELPDILQVISRYQSHLIINVLFSAICHPDEKIRFHAVRCFGQIVPAIAEKDLEAARIIMRRFLWSLNDESGGIGWGAPEAMAEIMCNSESLRKEYLHMLISYMREDGEELFQDGNFIELPMLQRGVLWGIGRLAGCHPSEMIAQNLVGDVAAYLESPDTQVKGLAIWCLGKLGGAVDSAMLTPFLANETELILYEDDTLQKLTIARIAEEALRLIDDRVFPV